MSMTQRAFCRCFCTPYFWVPMKDLIMTLTAAFTSSSLTYSRRCIAACASDMRMMLSMWRTATGMPSRVWRGERHA